jgi:hypothetical protein
MKNTKLSLVGLFSTAVLAALAGSSAIDASTISVVTFSEGGPAALMNSGLNPKSFWSIGAGSGDFSNSGNSAYSSQTGGAVTPEEANVLNEKLATFVVNEGGNKSAVPEFISGGQLVQVDGNQEFVSELFGGARQSGAAPFDYSVPENAPYYVQTFNPVPQLGFPAIVSPTHQGSITVTVPEPAALSLMAAAALGLLLLPKLRRS